MGIGPEQPEQPEASEDLDLVTAFYSEDHDSHIQVRLIRGLLEAGGVPAVIVEVSPYPIFPAEVRVPKSRLEEALRLIAESEGAGPSGAEEAEQSSEGPA